MELLAEPVLWLGRETGAERAGGAGACEEACPEVVEVVVRRFDLEGAARHVVEARRLEELGDLAVLSEARGRSLRRRRLDRSRRFPERAQQLHSLGEVPDAGGGLAAGAEHAAHLARRRLGIGHEVEDELRERRIEPAVRERQRLRAAGLYVGTWIAPAALLDEGVGGVDRGDGLGAEPAYELFRQRPGPQPTSSTRSPGEDPTVSTKGAARTRE